MIFQRSDIPYIQYVFWLVCSLFRQHLHCKTTSPHQPTTVWVGRYLTRLGCECSKKFWACGDYRCYLQPFPVSPCSYRTADAFVKIGYYNPTDKSGACEES